MKVGGCESGHLPENFNREKAAACRNCNFCRGKIGKDNQSTIQIRISNETRSSPVTGRFALGCLTDPTCLSAGSHSFPCSFPPHALEQRTLGNRKRRLSVIKPGPAGPLLISGGVSFWIRHNLATVACEQYQVPGKAFAPQLSDKGPGYVYFSGEHHRVGPNLYSNNYKVLSSVVFRHESLYRRGFAHDHPESLAESSQRYITTNASTWNGVNGSEDNGVDLAFPAYTPGYCSKAQAVAACNSESNGAEFFERGCDSRA